MKNVSARSLRSSFDNFSTGKPSRRFTELNKPAGYRSLFLEGSNSPRRDQPRISDPRNLHSTLEVLSTPKQLDCPFLPEPHPLKPNRTASTEGHYTSTYQVAFSILKPPSQPRSRTIGAQNGKDGGQQFFLSRHRLNAKQPGDDSGEELELKFESLSASPEGRTSSQRKKADEQFEVNVVDSPNSKFATPISSLPNSSDQKKQPSGRSIRK